MSQLNKRINYVMPHPWLTIKHFLPKSLFGRSLLILVTPLILVQVVLGYIFFDRHTETVLRLLSDTIAGDIALVTDLVEREDNFSRVQEVALNNLHLNLALQPGAELSQKGVHRHTWLYTFIGTALNEKIKNPYFVRMNSDFIYISVATSKGVLEVTLPRKRLFSRTTPLVLIWTTASAILLFIVASLFMRNQIRPIRRLAEAAERFGRGDDSISFKPEGAMEVRKAGFAFHVMRERLRRLLSERLEMLAGVSHDLRTPLTRMKLQLAMMEDNEELQSLKQDVRLMQEMVEGFLIYARGGIGEEGRIISINATLENLIPSFNTTTFNVELICGEEINAHIKIGLFNRCLTNLLLNSQKYARRAKVQAVKKNQHLQVIVDDDGPGIPSTEWENVFKPFYRLDVARNLDSGGVGLGLSIARDAIRSHGGQIFLRNSPLGGLRVIIRLPL